MKNETYGYCESENEEDDISFEDYIREADEIIEEIDCEIDSLRKERLVWSSRRRLYMRFQ